MKLIGLFFGIVMVVFDLIFAMIVSPYTLYKVFRNHRWRKRAQVGDDCYFKNMLGTRTWGKIDDMNGDQVRFVTPNSSQWCSLKGLRAV